MWTDPIGRESMRVDILQCGACSGPIVPRRSGWETATTGFW